MTTRILIAITIAVGAMAGMVGGRGVAAPARVESASMEPALRHGQRLLVRPRRSVRGLSRGDVVLVRSEEVGRVVVKRTIGLPGERIEIDAEGRVCVNGQRLDEPYARSSRPVTGAATYVVPRASLFLLGDNRAASSDRRSWRQPDLGAAGRGGEVLRVERSRACWGRRKGHVPDDPK